VGGRIHRREGGRRLVERHAELGRGPKGGERRRHEMTSGYRQAHLLALAVRVRDEANALDPGGTDVGRP